MRQRIGLPRNVHRCGLSDIDPRRIEFVNQCRELESLGIVDLDDAVAARQRLSDLEVKRGEQSRDRRTHIEAVEILARQREVFPELLAKIAELFDLRLLQPPVGLLRLERHLAPLLPVGELVGGGVIILLADESLRHKLLAAGDKAAEPRDLIVDLDQIAPVREPVLLKLQLRPMQILELLGDIRLARDDVELQRRVRQRDEKLPRLDMGTVLDMDSLDAPALDRVQIDRLQGRHPPAHGDEVLEPAARHRRDGEPALADYSWPGNVRALRHAVERAVILAGGDAYEVADFSLATPGASAAAANPGEGDFNLKRIERTTIAAALKAHGYNISHTAEALGLTRAALYRRMEKHGL